MAKITVNDSCIGCGACTAVAPDVFELGDEGLAVVVSEDNTDGEIHVQKLPANSHSF